MWQNLQSWTNQRRHHPQVTKQKIKQRNTSFCSVPFFLKCLVCVCVFRFQCEGTVEEKIATLQAKKKELAQNVLSGKGSALSKLSLADLRIIFGVWDSRQEALPHKHEPTVKTTDSTWNTYSKSQCIILYYISINKLFFFICILWFRTFICHGHFNFGGHHF